MVEKIEVQKIFAPLSSTARVKGLKRQNNNPQQREFENQLREEEEEKKKRKQAGQGSEPLARYDEKQEGMPGSEGGADLESDRKMEKGNRVQGKLIDIMV